MTAAPTPTLELTDLQGGILRGYNFPFATYVFVRDPDPAWVAMLAGELTTSAVWRTGKPAVVTNAALTATGLAALGVPGDGFPEEFCAGMAARAERLGDDGPSAPGHWEPGLRGAGEGHLLLWVSGRRSDAVAERLDGLLDGVRDEQIVHRQDTATLPFGREHFGFSDGFAQPSVFGGFLPNRPGEGVPQRFARWRLLRPGEIVLGYEDEDGVLPPAPPRPLHRNATFMVVRKLHQDVAMWRTWLRDAAERYAGGDEEWLAAKIVGRWTDGTPTALVPDRPKRRTITSLHEINAFRYGRDPEGLRCPVAAHIRRTNPRDGMAGGPARTRRHRMIRRGMPYGPPLFGDTDDGVDRGLWFVCFNASIARQFEVVQGVWANDGNVFGLGPGNRDFVIGGDTTGQPFVLPGSPPVRIPGPERPFVTVRGGEYLYVPSIRGLRAIGEGAAA